MVTLTCDAEIVFGSKAKTIVDENSNKIKEENKIDKTTEVVHYNTETIIKNEQIQKSELKHPQSEELEKSLQKRNIQSNESTTHKNITSKTIQRVEQKGEQTPQSQRQIRIKQPNKISKTLKTTIDLLLIITTSILFYILISK